MTRRRLIATVATLLLAAVLVSCQQTGARHPSVDLDEFSIAVAGALSGGRMTVPVTNGGEFGHTLVVSEVDGTVVAATDLIAPGSSADLVLELAPGEYEFTCRIVMQRPDGTIVDHYAEGMAAGVSVSG